MKSAAHELALKLDAEYIGVFGGSSGWVISVGTEPDSPGTAITLYDTGGLDPDTDEMDLLRPFVQVRVRSSSYSDAYAKQREIQAALIAIQSEVIEDHVYSFVVVESDILSLGRDDNDRSLFTCNYRVMRYAV